MVGFGTRQEAKPGGAPKSAWNGFNIIGLEADLAYFQARLEFIGTPATVNQKAQVDTFRFLTDATGRMLTRLRRKAPEK